MPMAGKPVSRHQHSLPLVATELRRTLETTAERLRAMFEQLQEERFSICGRGQRSWRGCSGGRPGGAHVPECELKGRGARLRRVW